MRSFQIQISRVNENLINKFNQHGCLLSRGSLALIELQSLNLQTFTKKLMLSPHFRAFFGNRRGQESSTAAKAVTVAFHFVKIIKFTALFRCFSYTAHICRWVNMIKRSVAFVPWIENHSLNFRLLTGWESRQWSWTNLRSDQRLEHFLTVSGKMNNPFTHQCPFIQTICEHKKSTLNGTIGHLHGSIAEGVTAP